MRAVRINGTGGPEVLTLVDDAPEPGPLPSGHARVRVLASALNRADLLQARGLYPAPVGVPADIPGLELSGEILEAGPSWRVGQRVMALVPGGAFAEQVILPENELLPLPGNLDPVTAAALPEAYCTAYDAAFLQGGLRERQTLLVHAVASGVGTAALQLGNAFGCTVLGTARSEWKLAECEKWGLRPGNGLHLPAAPPLFAEWVQARTLGQGAHGVLELVGGNYVPESLRSLAPRGFCLLVGLLAGRQAELDLGLLLTRRLRLVGTTLRSRPAEERAQLAARVREELLPRFGSGALKPVASDILPMKDVQEAARRMGSNELVGKLVLAW